MENQLFRKTSLEHISSPEQLHDYMRVTSPRLWMILGAIVLLLAGFIVYASTATMENTMTIQVQISQDEVEGNEAGEKEYMTDICAYLPGSMKGQVENGMTVRIGKEETKVSYGILGEDGLLFLVIDPVKDYIPLPEGTYDAELVLESTTPISFLWN